MSRRNSAKVSTVKAIAKMSSALVTRSLVPIAMGSGPMTSTAPPSSLRVPLSVDRAISSIPATASANPSANSTSASAKVLIAQRSESPLFKLSLPGKVFLPAS